MKTILNYIEEELDLVNPIQKDEQQDQIEGGVDAALAGEIFLYSETDSIFVDRKDAIVNALKEKLVEENITTDYISKTPIFQYYIRDLVNWYRKDIDSVAKLNISTNEELKRQVADDLVLKLKNIAF